MPLYGAKSALCISTGFAALAAPVLLFEPLPVSSAIILLCFVAGKPALERRTLRTLRCYVCSTGFKLIKFRFPLIFIFCIVNEVRSSSAYPLLISRPPASTTAKSDSLTPKGVPLGLSLRGTFLALCEFCEFTVTTLPLCTNLCFRAVSFL